MKMRHEARLIGKSVDKIRVRLDAIDRGQPQPFEIWRRAQESLHEFAKRQGTAKISAVGCQIDAGQNDLAESFVRQAAGRAKNLGHRHRAGGAATERNDTKRTAVIAAGL